MRHLQGLYPRKIFIPEILSVNSFFPGTYAGASIPFEDYQSNRVSSAPLFYSFYDMGGGNYATRIAAPLLGIGDFGG
jgi:hypothetical protein